LIRGNIPDRHYKDISYEKYYHAIARLEKDFRKRTSPVYRFRGAGIKAAQDVLQRRFIHQTVKEQRRLIPCYAGRLNLVLTEKGDVYPCEILSGRLGNIRGMDYDIMRVVQAEKARSILGSIKEGKCFCTHECYFMTNILFNPRMYPGLFEEYLHLGRRPLRKES
jgi:radical SAM protein with 4Fe4S-binding SPASM domain